jgi:hypothetical protein
MRPHLDDPALEWRGHSGIAIFPVGDLSSQTELVDIRPEFGERRFDPRFRFHNRSGLLRCSRRGIGDGRLFSSLAGQENQTGYG